MPTKPLGRRVEIKRPGAGQAPACICLFPTHLADDARLFSAVPQQFTATCFHSFCLVLGLSLLFCVCPESAFPMKICPTRPILRAIAHPRGASPAVTQLVPLIFVL